MANTAFSVGESGGAKFDVGLCIPWLLSSLHALTAGGSFSLARFTAGNLGPLRCEASPRLGMQCSHGDYAEYLGGASIIEIESP